jgi:hypothetical protein
MSDLDPYIVLCLLLLVPAVVIFIILNILRLRRAKFHRQRITKKSTKT